MGPGPTQVQRGTKELGCPQLFSKNRDLGLTLRPQDEILLRDGTVLNDDHEDGSWPEALDSTVMETLDRAVYTGHCGVREEAGSGRQEPEGRSWSSLPWDTGRYQPAHVLTLGL